jgi:biotin operon repressor
MNNNGYINIQGWMINELKLKGNELILYALIFGFSQDGQSKFYGSTRYIESALGISRISVMTLLNKLKQKGYIICVSESHYMAVKKVYQSDEKVVKKVYHGGKETLPLGGKETLPNIYNTNNKDNNIAKDKPLHEKVPEIIKAFEIINPACKRMYGNKTHRQACHDLIETYGFETVMSFIETVLPVTNTKLFWKATTPSQLWNNWTNINNEVGEKITKQKEKNNVVAF